MVKLAVKAPELAKSLGVDVRTIHAAIRRGELRGFKLGKNYFVPREELERLLLLGDKGGALCGDCDDPA